MGCIRLAHNRTFVDTLPAPVTSTAALPRSPSEIACSKNDFERQANLVTFATDIGGGNLEEHPCAEKAIHPAYFLDNDRKLSRLPTSFAKEPAHLCTFHQPIYLDHRGESICTTPDCFHLSQKSVSNTHGGCPSHQMLRNLGTPALTKPPNVHFADRPPGVGETFLHIR